MTDVASAVERSQRAKEFRTHIRLVIGGILWAGKARKGRLREWTFGP